MSGNSGINENNSNNINPFEYPSFTSFNKGRGSRKPEPITKPTLAIKKKVKMAALLETMTSGKHELFC